MKVLGVIPARYESSRLPGKPLKKIGSKSMIQLVYEAASKSKSLSDLIVATDDKRIVEAVRSFGGQVMMTSSKHRSGTDRCGEVISKQENEYDLLINIQGDEPFLDPITLDMLVESFSQPKVVIATLAIPIKDPELLHDTNTPKVIIDRNGFAIYFSRHAIPYLRGKVRQDWPLAHTYFKHIGVYAFSTKVLKTVTQLEPSPLEIAESLEQLRWLENGYQIQVVKVDKETQTVDTEADLKRARKFLAP